MLTPPTSLSYAVNVSVDVPAAELALNVFKLTPLKFGQNIGGLASSLKKGTVPFHASVMLVACV